MPLKANLNCSASPCSPCHADHLGRSRQDLLLSVLVFLASGSPKLHTVLQMYEKFPQRNNPLSAVILSSLRAQSKRSKKEKKHGILTRVISALLVWNTVWRETRHSKKETEWGIHCWEETPSTVKGCREVSTHKSNQFLKPIRDFRQVCLQLNPSTSYQKRWQRVTLKSYFKLFYW